MRQTASVFLAFSVLFSGIVYAAEKIAPRTETGDQSAHVKAVLFAPTAPIFLQLSIRVDNEPPARFRDRFCRQLFKQLDQSKDGLLGKREAEKFLKKLGEQLQSAKPVTWSEFQSDPPGDKVTPEKFRDFVDRRLGDPLVFVEKKPPGQEATNLFQILDRNADGALSAEELRLAAQTLKSLDADDDETISIAELNASQAKKSPDLPSANADAATMTPVSEATVEAIAKRVAVYDTSIAKTIGVRPVRAAALGLSSTAVRTFDRDNDGMLASSELKEWILHAPAALAVSIELYDLKRSRARASVAKVDGTLGPLMQTRPSSGEIATIDIDGFPLVLTAKRTQASVGDKGSFYTLRFSIVDKDKNNYLDKMEFQALGLPNVDFGAVDSNGDGQLVQQELMDYLNAKGTVLINQIQVTVTDESKSLFEYLDTRADGRLSPRELLSAVNRAAQLDRNKDGQLTQGELRTRIDVAAEVKRPAEPRTGMMVRAPRNSANSATISRDRGPEWFLRMDRNYDGDVSRREFLGSQQVFDRLDVDHDGLLSPEEAEAAK